MSLDALLSAADPQRFLDALPVVHLLGATDSVVTFRCTPTLLHTEEQSRRTLQAGTLLPTAWQATLSGTLTTVTTRSLARLLNLAEADVLIPGSFAPLTTLLFLADTTDGSLAIELTAPLSTGGLTLITKPRGTGALPFTFTAQQTVQPPCRIALLKGGDA